MRKIRFNIIIFLILPISLLATDYLNQMPKRFTLLFPISGLYDPTSIMNADTLNKCQREGWIKLAFYLLSFFYYLYG